MADRKRFAGHRQQWDRGGLPARRAAIRRRDAEVVELDQGEIPDECVDCGTPVHAGEPFGMCARCRALDAWEADHA